MVFYPIFSGEHWPESEHSLIYRVSETMRKAFPALQGVGVSAVRARRRAARTVCTVLRAGQ